MKCSIAGSSSGFEVGSGAGTFLLGCSDGTGDGGVGVGAVTLLCGCSGKGITAGFRGLSPLEVELELYHSHVVVEAYRHLHLYCCHPIEAMVLCSLYQFCLLFRLVFRWFWHQCLKYIH